MVTGTVEVAAIVQRVLSIDMPSASFDTLRWVCSAMDQVRGWSDATTAEAMFEMSIDRPLPPDPDPDAADPDVAGGGPSAGRDTPGPEPEVNTGPKFSAAEVLRRQRRAEFLAAARLFAAALRAGEIHTGHVDVVAAILAEVTEQLRSGVLDIEEQLVDIARSSTADVLARRVRRRIDELNAAAGVERAAQQRANSRINHWFDMTTEMHQIHGQIDPERGAAAFAALDAEIHALYRSGEVNGLSAEQVAAQALVNLLCAATSGTQRKSAPQRAAMTVLVDLRTLLEGHHQATVLEASSGATLCVEAARRLFCDGEVTYAFTIDGIVVKQITENPLATRHQRRALRAMYRTCVHPECSVPFDRCHLHHVIFRERHGRTIIENLVPVCFRHHHSIHDYGWRLTIDPDRTLHWYRPDSTLHATCPYVPLAALDRTDPAATARGPTTAAPRAGPAPPVDAAHTASTAAAGAAGSASAPGPAGTTDDDGELRLFTDNQPAA